jgi:uncharacterized protein YcfJ
METIKTATSRIHPLMAAAAVSVIVVSLAGAAAITGILPSSHSAPEAGVPTAQAAAPAGALPMAAEAPQGVQPVQGAYAQPTQGAYAQQAVASAQPAPTVIKETVIKEVPAKPKHTVHHTNYAQNDAPAYHEPAPRAAPQPNYVAIGTGAVVGGLLGNQVGSGNGRKLATVAGIIGGGMLGNQIANQNQGR